MANSPYIWTAEGWLIAAVVDLFSRRVVGWSMKAKMTAQLVTDALIMAIWRRGKPDSLLPVESAQYVSIKYTERLDEAGIEPVEFATLEWVDWFNNRAG